MKIPELTPGDPIVIETSDWALLPGGVGPGQHVFAIGDINGNGRLLGAVLAHIAGQSITSERPADLVFLGNIIGPGPRNRLSVKHACAALADISFGETVALIGMEEIVAFEGLTRSGSDLDKLWRQKRLPLWINEDTPMTGRERPSEINDLLDVMRPAWRCGDIIFVHSGLHPQMTHAQALRYGFEATDPHHPSVIGHKFLDWHYSWADGEKIVICHSGEALIDGPTHFDDFLLASVHIQTHRRVSLNALGGPIGQIAWAEFHDDRIRVGWCQDPRMLALMAWRVGRHLDALDEEDTGRP